MHTFYPGRHLRARLAPFLTLVILDLVVPPIAAFADPAPSASAPGSPAPVLRLPVTAAPPAVLPAGTPIVLRLTQRLKSGEAKAGDRVTFEVAEPVSLGQTVVIPVGTPASGHVESARGAGAFGRAGALRLRCDTILLPGGVSIPIQARTPLDLSGRSGLGTAEATGIAAGLTAGGAAYGGSDVNRNLLSSSPDRTTPTLVGLTTGVVVGALVVSLFRGGEVTLDRGRRLEVTLTQETPVPVVLTQGTHALN